MCTTGSRQDPCPAFQQPRGPPPSRHPKKQELSASRISIYLLFIEYCHSLVNSLMEAQYAVCPEDPLPGSVGEERDRFQVLIAPAAGLQPTAMAHLAGTIGGELVIRTQRTTGPGKLQTDPGVVVARDFDVGCDVHNFDHITQAFGLAGRKAKVICDLKVSL